MIYPIVIYGNSVLKRVAEPINRDYPELQTLIDDMFKTLTKAEGVGLAAPQIGLSIRLFIIDLSPLAEDNPEFKDYKKVFINPTIIEYSDDEKTAEEGCLSLPGLSENVSTQRCSLSSLLVPFSMSMTILKVMYTQIGFLLYASSSSPRNCRRLQRGSSVVATR